MICIVTDFFSPIKFNIFTTPATRNSINAFRVYNTLTNKTRSNPTPMKSLLGLVFLCFQTLAYCQLNFEEVTSPVDFSMASFRQSPTGEYFVQGVSDYKNIYTSLDGINWTKTPLPENHVMKDIQFFSDGTPVLQSEDYQHLIRRNGTWYTMNATGGIHEISASFIKGDSLFVFQDQSFAYSLDKGKTFIIAFTAAESIVDHRAHLWKLDNHYVLHHTAGASESLAIFTEDGSLVSDFHLDISGGSYTYNSCGQVLINDGDHYYLVAENGHITQGATLNLIPNYSYNSDLVYQNGTYYLRTENILYKSTGCDFFWDVVIDDDLVSSKEYFWVNHQGDFFLYDRRRDYYLQLSNGTQQWVKHPININYAFVLGVDESAHEHQLALTPNTLYYKNVSDGNWIKVDNADDEYLGAQYSPDGDLYVNGGSYILYSVDNGNYFDTIPVPNGNIPELSYSMVVLENDILFLYDDFFGDCFYTLNNGKDWIPTNVLLFGFAPPSIKLVDNAILVADFDPAYVITKINLGTNESTSIDLGSFTDFSSIGAVIQDDGTIYFQAFSLNGGHPDGLYRYRFGEEPEFLGEFAEPSGILTMMTSGNDLYFIASNKYHLFNGVSFEEYSFSGLPSSVSKSFFISEDEHVYVILDKHRIFRSTRPLSYPQTITGRIYHDVNEDCDIDTLEGTLKNWKVKIEGEGRLRITTTDSEGKYHVSVPKGEYIVSSQPNNSNWDLCEYSYAINIDENNPNVNADFLALGLADCATLDLDFSTPLLRRCFDNYYVIRILNTGPEASKNTTLTLELDPFFDFISATIPSTLVNDSIIQFDLGTLEVNEEITFRVLFNISCDAGLGIEHCLTGILNADNECGNSRSSYTECQENIGSVDPNDKRIFNEAGKEVTAVDKGEYIYYHIRFQNTGTDTAFNVKVVDLLSSMLDFNTIEVLSASHPYTFEINDGPALVVNFKDILLPDSTTNEPASHGYFKFRIKPLAAFDYGTSIPNQAGIYFDFNEAVNTNEATLVIQHPDGTKEAIDYIEFNIYPNPATSTLSLDIPESDLNRIDGYEIVDQLGQALYQSRYAINSAINVTYLTPGTYSLVLKENGINIGTRKFVKL